MKFCGKIGFWFGDTDKGNDVYAPNCVEKKYFGDVLNNIRKFQNDSTQNDVFTVNNKISILADLYLEENWPSIRYVIWNNTSFKVTSVSVDYPRIILEIGGIWNGETEERVW